MPRDARAHLADVIDACKAIMIAVGAMDLDAYVRSRLIRSSVEREFIIIGEALAGLSRTAEDIFDRIAQGRRIIDFRNQLTHEYPTVDDALVWAIIDRDVPVLCRECTELLKLQPPSDPGGTPKASKLESQRQGLAQIPLPSPKCTEANPEERPRR